MRFIAFVYPHGFLYDEADGIDPISPPHSVELLSKSNLPLLVQSYDEMPGVSQLTALYSRSVAHYDTLLSVDIRRPGTAVATRSIEVLVFNMDGKPSNKAVKEYVQTGMELPARLISHHRLFAPLAMIEEVAHYTDPAMAG